MATVPATATDYITPIKLLLYVPAGRSLSKPSLKGPVSSLIPAFFCCQLSRVSSKTEEC